MIIDLTNIKKNLIAGSLCFSCITCNKDTDQAFPEVPVDIKLNIYTDLGSLGVGTAMISPISGGIKGIIIYRSSLYEYVAYDRLCTNFPNDTCALVIDNSKIIAISPCSGSKFLLTNGSVLKGPARLPLIKYSVSIDDYYIYIINAN